MRAACAGARSSLSPLSTPPRQPTPGLLRTRSSPSRLNSTHISPDVDSEVASYLAPSFELSTKTDSSIASNAKPSETATKTKAPAGTRKDFVKPPASAVTAAQRNSIYGKAFELLDDGTLVESVIDPFGSLSLNGNAALQRYVCPFRGLLVALFFRVSNDALSLAVRKEKERRSRR